MRVDGKNYHTIWVHPENSKVIQVIDQRLLPFEFSIADLQTPSDAFEAIKNMTVRGAPLIGVTGAFGVYLGLVSYKGADWKKGLETTAGYLKSARPTAVNLAILIDEMVSSLIGCSSHTDAVKLALNQAKSLKSREITWSEAIGDYGCGLIEAISRKKNGEPVNILTHCNAGWLA